MIQRCRITGKEFEIDQWEQDFCAMMEVPLPIVCPEERLRRRLLERNTRALYYRNCDFSGKKIISQFHSECAAPVYEQSIWWSDQWSPFDYGRDFDFSRPFFEQFLELKNQVPRMSVFVIGATLENSDFTNCTGYLKNCYLICESDYDEDCYYSNRIYHSKDLADCSNCYKCELCYQCIDCLNSQRLYYSQDCENCFDSYFLKNCISCRDCIACTNQRQKQYMIANKQYSKEDYQKLKKEFALDTYSGVQKLQQRVGEFYADAAYKNLQTERCENCSGDYLYDSKNSKECFDCKDLEDCRYCVKVAGGVKDAMDYSSWGFKAERIYQTTSSGDNVYNLRFCTNCTTNVSNATYCYGCTGSNNIFGCVSLKKGEYCILNKKYSPEEYQNMLARIIEHMKKTGEWGEFFPAEQATFAYNESLAIDHLPLSREQALAQVYRWRERDENEFRPGTADLPDGIDEVDKSLCEQVLACAESGKNYRILESELNLYRKLKVPVPRLCPDQRHLKRMQKKNPWQLFEKECAKCHSLIETSFRPEFNVKVYCKDCYLREVY